MVKLVNRAKMTVASGGAGDITLGTAVDGYQTFADAGVSDTDVVRYTIEDGDNWEIGTGVYTASGTTLVRTVTESSNSDSALTCSADAVIFVTMAAEDFTNNALPRWTTTPPSELEMEAGVSATITGVAIDEAGFPIQYSWDGYSGSTIYSPLSLPAQISTAPTFDASTKTWTLTPSTSLNDAGNFIFRSRASDGVNTLTANTAASLTFMYRTGMLGWYDVNRSTSYTSGSSSMYDLSGNSGPTMTVNTRNISYVAGSTGGLATVQIAGPHAISTSTSFGTGATCVIISSDTETRVYQWRLFSPSPSTTSVFLYYVNAGGAYAGTNDVFSGPNGGLGENTTSSKVYVDKALKVVGSSPTGYTTSQFYADIFGPELHSIALTDMDLSSGWSFGGEANRYPRMKVRAILFYDHEPTAANIAKIHDYYKAEYSSDTDMAP